ncbi:MAG TPA: amidase domain-containing protein [Firmicutes bacterium]|nr:amidase domain-containing protein [Bacillota bacterium]
MMYTIHRGVATHTNSELRETLTHHIAAVLKARVDALLSGDELTISKFYETETRYGRWALDHELRRIRYVKAWSTKRGVRFTEAGVNFRIKSVENRGESVWVSLVQDVTFAYTYEDVKDNTPHGSWRGDGQATGYGVDLAAGHGSRPAADGFRIGTRHTMEFVKRDSTWLIRRDWYTDPLDEDTLVPEVKPAEHPGEASKGGNPAAGAGEPYPHRPPTAQAGGTQAPGRYNREAAVAYADRYWHEYNPKYKDCTGSGGDCTNFVSQVLGDPEAGGLPMDWTWYYRFSPLGGGGSRAWVQTEGFAGYLLNNGRARRIARGTWSDIIQQGAIEQLQKGDLIGYEEKGRIEHFAIVVGRDSHGYVLVNSHTADRYHVPWDLGWDRQTVFWLLEIVG